LCGVKNIVGNRAACLSCHAGKPTLPPPERQRQFGQRWRFLVIPAIAVGPVARDFELFLDNVERLAYACVEYGYCSV